MPMKGTVDEKPRICATGLLKGSQVVTRFLEDGVKEEWVKSSKVMGSM